MGVSCTVEGWNARVLELRGVGDESDRAVAVGIDGGSRPDGDARHPPRDRGAGRARRRHGRTRSPRWAQRTFPGVDAPEVSFTLPGGAPDRFVPITDQAWVEVLDDPLSAALPAFDPPLTAGLRGHLAARTGAGTAANHAQLARGATLALRDEVTRDMTELGQDAHQFQFFLAFAGEVMDRYGRLLCYLNRDEPEPGPGGRPDTYNERLLAAGWVTRQRRRPPLPAPGILAHPQPRSRLVRRRRRRSTVHRPRLEETSSLTRGARWADPDARGAQVGNR